MSTVTQMDERAAFRRCERIMRRVKPHADALPDMPPAEQAQWALIVSTARQAPEQEARPA